MPHWKIEALLIMKNLIDPLRKHIMMLSLYNIFLILLGIFDVEDIMNQHINVK